MIILIILIRVFKKGESDILTLHLPDKGKKEKGSQKGKGSCKRDEDCDSNSICLANIICGT